MSLYCMPIFLSNIVSLCCFDEFLPQRFLTYCQTLLSICQADGSAKVIFRVFFPHKDVILSHNQIKSFNPFSFPLYVFPQKCVYCGSVCVLSWKLKVLWKPILADNLQTTDSLYTEDTNVRLGWKGLPVKFIFVKFIVCTSATREYWMLHSPWAEMRQPTASDTPATNTPDYQARSSRGKKNKHIIQEVGYIEPIVHLLASH